MKNRIVIIGGMGPQASLYFHKLLIDYYAEHGAKNNADYPEIVHISIPVPDFINSNDSSGAERMLEDVLSKISFLVTDKVFLTCNTVHKLQDSLEKHTGGIKIISLIDEVENYLTSSSDEVKKVGLLASPMTISSGLYSKPLENKGISVIASDIPEQNAVEDIIRDVISNIEPSQYREHFIQPLEKLFQSGAEKIILGCTEISLVFNGGSDDRIIDPLKIAIQQNIKLEPKD